MSADQSKHKSIRSALVRGFNLVLVVLLLPIGLLLGALWFLVCVVVLVLVWLTWLPRGKDVLLVYSNSPHWQEYFEAGLLPQVADRAEVLNWSERATWPVASLRTIAFQVFSGAKEYNPMLFLFSPFRWPKRVRFYQAFRDFRHGNESTLSGVERQLSEILNQPVNPDDFRLRSST